MYWLELAGEDDPFAALEASSAAADVTLRGPGVATASALAPERCRGLAFVRAAGELLGLADASVDGARTLLDASSLSRAGSDEDRSGDDGDRSSTVAVRARDVRGSAAVDTQRAERELGSVLVERSFEVDLDDPDHVLRALFARGSLARDPANDGEGPAGEASPSGIEATGADDALAVETSDRVALAEDADDADVCALGWVGVERAGAFGDRAPTDRPFFQPGSMDPRLARAFANLAGARPGATVLDPMCGTGGICLEAALVGARAVGVDAQGKMVRGARENLSALLDGEPAGDTPADGEPADDTPADGEPADDTPADGESVVDEPVDGEPAGDGSDDAADRDALDRPTPVDERGAWGVLRGDARRLPVADDAVDGLVVDVPYERQSAVAADDLSDLVTRALAEARRVATRAIVVGDRSWTAAARDAGWSVACVHRRRVHRSLVRWLHVLEADSPGMRTGEDLRSQSS